MPKRHDPDGLKEHYESLVHRYMQACSDADTETVRQCFTPDAVHYFPPGMYGGPFRGADVIADRWKQAVAELGSYWTVDRLIVDAESHQAAMEWTHFKRKLGIVLRGDEWYQFDPESGLIREIRAYYASPQADGMKRLELDDFDYRERGYALDPPEL